MRIKAPKKILPIPHLADLAVDTIVWIKPNDIKMGDGSVAKGNEPYLGKIVGYDMNRTKYQIIPRRHDNQSIFWDRPIRWAYPTEIQVVPV